MVGFTFASSVLLASLCLSNATPPTPSATYPPTASEFPTSSTYEPTLTEYPTYFDTYYPTITAYPTTAIESPTVTLAMAVSEARRQQNADGTKKLSLKGAAVSIVVLLDDIYNIAFLYTLSVWYISSSTYYSGRQTLMRHVVKMMKMELELFQHQQGRGAKKGLGVKKNGHSVMQNVQPNAVL